MAPSGDSKYAHADNAAYADFALGYVPQPWAFEEAVFPESVYGLNGAATWQEYDSLSQGCGQTLSCDTLPANWMLASPTELSMAFAQTPALFASPSSQPPAHPVTAVAAPELQHPRPQRAFVPSWQTAPDFNAEHFLAGAAETRGESSRQDILPLGPQSSATLEAIEHTNEDFTGSDSGDDLDEDWDDDLEFEENPSEEIDADSCAHGLADVDVGPGIGLGSSTWTLDSNSILYKPVATPLRCPSRSNMLWPGSMADSCVYPAVTPSFA